MNNIFQNRERVVLCAFMVIALFLAGCPKKVGPLGKPSKSPSILEEGRLVDKGGRVDTNPEGGMGLPTVQEEDISSSPGKSLIGPNGERIVPAASAPLAGSENLMDVFFDYGQSTVRPADIPLLAKNVKWLLANPIKKIELEGHADKRGTNEYNLVLAEKRAGAVREYLVQLGIDSSKILVISFGEERPFCPREDEACFQENRRAHFHVE
jgi:peptidoglycan-associated lipoprotein